MSITVFAENFVHVKFDELSYSEGGVTHAIMRAWFSYATKFCTYSQKYKIYEIKSHTKSSAIIVSG